MKKIRSSHKIIMSIFIFILFSFNYLYSNLPSGPVQGLCRVTLNDNSVIEGVILISTCGYSRICGTNGFILYNDKEVRPKLFNYDFESINFYKEGKEHQVGLKYLGEHESKYSLDDFEVYFVEDISSTFHYLTNFEFEFVDDTSVNKRDDKILRRKYFTEYRLLDYVPIMPKIPDEVFITPIKLKDQFLKIPLKDMVKLEMIHDPSEVWLKNIELAEKHILPDSEGDKVYPVWFHQIVNQPHRNQKYFKVWPY